MRAMVFEEAGKPLQLKDVPRPDPGQGQVLIKVHTCGTRPDGSLWCWGRGADGQLGLGNSLNQTTPQQLFAGHPTLAIGWDRVSSGGSHTCSTRTEDSLWCWGNDGDGRLGLGNVSSQNTPQQVGIGLL